MARGAADDAEADTILNAAVPASGALRARIISALVMAPLALAAVWFGGWAFHGMVLAGALMLTFEWDRLCEGNGFGAVARLHGAVVLLAVGFAMAEMFATSLLMVGLGAAASFAFAQATERRRRWPLLASPYICIPCIALIWLRGDPMIGRDITFWLLATVWATDIGAFAVGRTLGGPKLAPRFSPAKTWSGLVGGMLSAALAGYAVTGVFGTSNQAILVGLSLVIAAWSQVGDITESALKRHFGAKDSGSIIPGHGGFLDRLDGLLFAAPATAAIVLISTEWGFQWH
jgi:phosphatidate cytidylyltransferase